MPINRKKMAALKQQYGKEKGEQVYYALEKKAQTQPYQGKAKKQKPLKKTKQ